MADKLGFYGVIPTKKELEKRAKQEEKNRIKWEKEHPYIDDMSLKDLKDYIKSVILSLSADEKEKFMQGLISFKE